MNNATDLADLLREIRGKLSSVPVIQTKLNQSGRNDRCRDLSKGRRCADVHGSWETKDRMVPQIESIHAEAQVVAFLDVDALDD